MFFSYQLYGLEVRVNQVIPALTAKAVGSMRDLDIYFGPLPFRDKFQQTLPRPWFVSPYLDEEGSASLTIWQEFDPEYFRMEYSDGAEFLIDRAGKKIWCAWPGPLSLDDMAVYLLGPVMAFVLLLRGTFSLHASAIAVGNQALALVGRSGAGKSTTAAAFARLGYPVLAEDVTALVDKGGRFLVQPAYPMIRLLPNSVEILFGDTDALPSISPTGDKYYLALNGNKFSFQSQPLPLSAIYLFGERRNEPAAPFVENVPVKESLLQLVKHSYAAMVLDGRMRGSEFEQFGRLLADAPMRRVRAHTDPAHLFKLCEVILDDFHKNAAVMKTHAGHNVL